MEAINSMRSRPMTARPHPHILRGIALRCAAVGCFALMSALMKRASEDHVNAIEMLFYRSWLGLPILLAWTAIGPGLGTLRTTRPLAHFGRSILGISGILMNFQALILLPLADAITIGFTAPIFATLMSASILGEQVGIHRWSAVLFGFVGILIIVRPGGEALPGLGVLCAIAGAVGTASVTVVIRQLGETEHPAAIVFWFFCCSGIASGIAMVFFGHAHTPATYGILCLAAFAGAAAQLFMTTSLKAAPVSVLSPYDYTQIIWAGGLGWMMWAMTPSLNTLGGAALITASGIYTVWREHRHRKVAVAATPPLE